MSLPVESRPQARRPKLPLPVWLYGRVQNCAKRRSQAGFTLVEVLTVIVILAILSAAGSSFYVRTVDAYRTTQLRSELVQKGRLVTEQLARQLRLAAPNSVRLSPSGHCLEFLPLVAVTSSLAPVPDSHNGMAASAAIAVLPIDWNPGQAKHLLVAPFNPQEIYQYGSLAARAGFGGAVGNPVHTVTLASPHRFLRNSPSLRLFISDDPLRFCINGDQLMQYSGYGLLTAPVTDLNPGGEQAVMLDGLVPQHSAFQLSPGSEDRNAAVIINLQLSAGRNSVQLNHQVLIRNVP